MIIQYLAITGFILSAYAHFVTKKAKQPKYKAICDINNNISCSKAFKSPYGSITGISNTILGLVFYAIILILALLNQKFIILLLSIAAVLGSLYLAYILYFKLKNFCIICNAIYIINILLLIFSII
jgi:vitamin-K-epoxide reductase (warfarin-sensitive)